MEGPIVNPRREFFDNLRSLCQTLSIRFPECTASADAVKLVETEVEQEAEGDVRIVQWYLKMKTFMSMCSDKTEAALVRVSSFGVLEHCGLSEKLLRLPAEDINSVWQYINNCNSMCMLYDEQSEDTPFSDITEFAEKLMLLFPKEDIKSGGYLEIMKHIPNLIGNEEMHSLIARLGAQEDRMERVFGLIELQFGTKIDQTQRELMSATMKQAAATLADEQTRNILSSFGGALPDFLDAGRAALGQLFDSNPDMKGIVDAVLGSAGIGGGGGGAGLQDLEAAAEAAVSGGLAE